MTLNKNLAVGEVDGDGIGCFLFGVEATPLSPISYHSLATSPAELVRDCTDFFTALARDKELMASKSVHSARHKQDLKIIQNTLENLPSFIAMYLTSDRSEPFLEFGGLTIFLRTGARQRERIEGRYVE